MHVDRENIEISKSVRSRARHYGLCGLKLLAAARQGYFGRLFAAAGFLYFDNKEGFLPVELWIVEFRLMFFESLKLDLNPRRHEAPLQFNIVGQIAGNVRCIPSKTLNGRNHFAHEHRLRDDAAHASLGQIRGTKNCAEDRVRVYP